MMSAKPRKSKTGSSHRATASAVAILLAMLRVGAPLIVIAAAAFWFLNLRSDGSGSVRVSTSVPGADILVGGSQTGFRSDTTLDVPVGRRIITVRKSGYVSEPEFIVLNVAKKRSHSASFVLKSVETPAMTDSILPLRPVRQEVFESGERMNLLPPVIPRSERRMVDFAGLRERESVGSRPELRYQPLPNQLLTESAGADFQGNSSLIGTEITVSSNPEGSEIWVNGAATTRSTPYTFRGLDRGVYVFTILRAGFISNPDSAVVTLNRDYQKELVAFELSPERMLPRPSVEVSTTPLAAGFRVDGKAAGVGKATLELDYGNHRIEFADVPGFRTPDPVSVTLTEAQRSVQVRGVYQKLLGNAYLAVLPSSDIDKFDGTQLRVYVDNELLLDSPKKQYDGALIGKIAAGKRLIRIEYGDLSNDAHVDFTDGQVAEVTFRIESFFSKRKLKLRSKTGIMLEEWQSRAKDLTVLSSS